jgi:hypothetical protein
VKQLKLKKLRLLSKKKSQQLRTVPKKMLKLKSRKSQSQRPRQKLRMPR